MITTSVRVETDGTVADLANLDRASALAVKQAVNRSGGRLQRGVRRNASTGYHPPGVGHLPGTGPGPNVATGDYRRSIARTPVSLNAEGAFQVVVSTNAPQAWRLERGFVGVDSAGRSYHQPPFPHWGPAVDAEERLFAADLAKIIDQLAGVSAAGFGGLGAFVSGLGGAS